MQAQATGSQLELPSAEGVGSCGLLCGLRTRSSERVSTFSGCKKAKPESGLALSSAVTEKCRPWLLPQAIPSGQSWTVGDGHSARSSWTPVARCGSQGLGMEGGQPCCLIWWQIPTGVWQKRIHANASTFFEMQLKICTPHRHVEASRALIGPWTRVALD